MFKRLMGISLTFGMAAAAPPVFAQSCAERTTVIERLEEAYSEALTAGGLQKTRAGQSVLEVWSSPETGTFTVLLTHANGLSCIVAAGTDFFDIEAEPAPDGQAS